MKYLIIIAIIMWSAFFYTNAKAGSVSEAAITPSCQGGISGSIPLQTAKNDIKNIGR